MVIRLKVYNPINLRNESPAFESRIVETISKVRFKIAIAKSKLLFRSAAFGILILNCSTSDAVHNQNTPTRDKSAGIAEEGTRSA